MDKSNSPNTHATCSPKANTRGGTSSLQACMRMHVLYVKIRRRIVYGYVYAAASQSPSRCRAATSGSPPGTGCTRLRRTAPAAPPRMEYDSRRISTPARAPSPPRSVPVRSSAARSLDSAATCEGEGVAARGVPRTRTARCTADWSAAPARDGGGEGVCAVTVSGEYHDYWTRLLELWQERG